MRYFVLLVFAALAGPGWAFEFPLLRGGTFETQGKVVLVVNTASKCAFTRQFDDLQALYDRYRTEGLTVLTVPSQDFRQELATGDQVAEFCAVNFDIDMPMSQIETVRGPDAHPFYKWVKQVDGFVPSWNFNKILLDAQGNVVATFNAPVRPLSKRMTQHIEEALQSG